MKYVNDAELKRIGNMTPFSIAIEIQDLRKERDLANENVRVYSGLSAGRATKINALESNLMEARKQLDALESNISNLNEAYGDLLARFNAREEDFVRVQKRFDFEHDRADKNYAMTEESRKIIVKQTNELRQANDLYMMVSNNNNHLNKVIEDLKAAPAIPKHATWEAIAEREKELKCEAFRRINELEAEVAAWKCNSCSDNENAMTDLKESNEQKTRLIEELNKIESGLRFDLKVATDALETTKLDRDSWRNSCGVADKHRKNLVDKVIELETEIARLSRFEPLEQEELAELERLRQVVFALEFKHKLAMQSLEQWKASYDDCTKDNKELQSKYDKLKDGIEQICSDNGIRE